MTDDGLRPGAPPLVPPLVQVRIWDLPTRGFHWLLAVCVVFSVITAKVGGNALVWHFRSGYVVLALLAFRLLWGFVGGRWSRFSSLLHRPRTMLRYLRRQSLPDEMVDVGHNPLGALSVFALLVVLIVQAASGLFADDEIASTGPLIRFVSGATSAALTSWHKTFGQWTVLGLVALHLAAIVFHRLRRHDLVTPMLTGDKPLAPGTPASADGAASRLLALLLAGLCTAGVAWLVSLGG